MNLSILLKIIQLILGVSIIGLVLLQQQDAGFYANTSNINRTRRGTEKIVYNLTIVLGTLFVVAAVTNFLLSQ